jgi:hypothetical protein
MQVDAFEQHLEKNPIPALEQATDVEPDEPDETPEEEAHFKTARHRVQRNTTVRACRVWKFIISCGVRSFCRSELRGAWYSYVALRRIQCR